jgi:hypothetical protein
MEGWDETIGSTDGLGSLVPDFTGTAELIPDLKVEKPELTGEIHGSTAVEVHTKHDPDEYRNLLLLTLANRVIRMTDVSGEIADLQAEIVELRKTLKAAFLAIGHGSIGAKFEAPAPRAVVEGVTDNGDSFRNLITESDVQEVLAKLKE